MLRLWRSTRSIVEPGTIRHYSDTSYMEMFAMRRVTAREANQQFSTLLALASNGEEIIITRHGEPVATLAPYKPPRLTSERQAAVEHAIELMERGLPLGVERPFTRDEMHER